MIKLKNINALGEPNVILNLKNGYDKTFKNRSFMKRQTSGTSNDNE